MKTYFSGNEEIFLSVSDAYSDFLTEEKNLFYKDENGLLRKIDFIRIGEEITENFASLRYGEWNVSIEDNTAEIEGRGIEGVLDALDHFFSLFEKGNPCFPRYFYAEKKTYPVQSITVDSCPLSSFQILYADEINPTKEKSLEGIYRTCAAEQAATDLISHVAKQSGILLPLFPITNETKGEKAIVIGVSDPALSYGESKVASVDGSVFVYGNDICALESAVSHLCAILTKGEIISLSLSDFSFSSSIQKREEYENDSSLFSPVYKERYALNDEEISFERKKKKLQSPEDGVFIIAHRGEHTYYPENSLECCISAWRCGADSVEVDLSRTRDGIVVCMHDETLSRTTDVDRKKGKNGLPDSVKLSDWSLEELRELRLLDSYGKITPFLIPTLEELFLACNRKIFLHLDKKFDYVNEIFPIMEKHSLYECLYLCNYIDAEGILALRDYFCEKGIVLPSILRIKKASSRAFREETGLVLNDSRYTPAVIYLNDFKKNLLHQNKTVQTLKGNLRFGSWMMWDSDFLYYWRKAEKYGFNILMTNHPIRMRCAFQ